MTYVGQGDQIFILIAVVSDEREDFWGDLVYWYEAVLCGPNGAQHLEEFMLEKVNLGHDNGKLP